MFKSITKNGVRYLVSDIIPAPHGFSTKNGGKSKDPATASMNFGSSVEDEWVGENIKIFTKAAALPSLTVRARQIHSNKIACFFTEKDLDNIDGDGFLSQGCDGFITDMKGLSLCVRTADCLPIIMSDRKGELVASLHAGWRGSVAGIAGCAVDVFLEKGIKKEDIFAALGPCISVCCFEVGADFIESFKSSPCAHLADLVIENRENRYYCDLKKLNYLILTERGIPKENIDVCPDCTHHQPSDYFSHRRTSFNRGTMGSLVAVKE